jgi:3-hydroxyacyl-CoA dehydrogenase
MRSKNYSRNRIADEDEEAQTVGIVGAAVKGRELAAFALLGGFRVILEDISSKRLAESQAYIASVLDAALAQGKIDFRRKRELADGMSITQSVDQVSRGADLLIEAAPEDAELQLEIFTIFDKFAKPGAILASTARSVSVTDLSEITSCPERCVGLEVPGELSVRRSIRIIKTAKTSQRSAEICATFARRLGFDPEIVIESPTSIIASAPGTARS